MTQSCCPPDESERREMCGGDKLKPGQSSEKHEVGEREKGKDKAEWLG